MEQEQKQEEEEEEKAGLLTTANSSTRPVIFFCKYISTCVAAATWILFPPRTRRQPAVWRLSLVTLLSHQQLSLVTLFSHQQPVTLSVPSLPTVPLA